MTTNRRLMKADLATQESLGIRSGHLFRGCQEIQEFLDFQGCRRSQEGPVSQEFLGCLESQYQEPLQGWGTFTHGVFSTD